jgi:signal transduction histidine kinase
MSSLRNLRTQIIIVFSLLMLAGGALTTLAVGYQLEPKLDAWVMRHAYAVLERAVSEIVAQNAVGDRAAAERVAAVARVGHGDIVYVAVADRAGRPVALTPAETSVVLGQGDEAEVVVGGQAVTDVSAPLPGSDGWRVHVGISLRLSKATLALVIRNVVYTTLGGLVVGVVVIWIAAGLLTRPVRRLRDAARALGRGELEQDVAVAPGGELGALAATFNEMAHQIRLRVSESDRLRAYYEGILDQMPSGVTVCGTEGKLEYANRAAREHGRLIGLACHGPSFEHCGYCRIDATLRAGGEIDRFHVAPSGHVYELAYVPFQGTDHAGTVIVTSVDVTEKTKLTQRLQRAERLAVAGEVAAGIVHTINNPLDGVRRALEMGRRDPALGKRTADMLALASEGIERIAAVTRTLLNLARAELASAPTHVEPNACVADVLRLVELRAHAKGIEIATSLDPAVPEIEADPRGLNEVLVSLLVNAVDATPGGGHVVVSTSRSDGMVEFRVQDDGVGIQPENLERVFEPFFTTKDVGHGTGLGLSVARRVVEAHGGDISVESEIGKGASFRVRWPVVKGEGDRAWTHPAG